MLALDSQILPLALKLALLALALSRVLVRRWARGQGLLALLVCAPTLPLPDDLCEPGETGRGEGEGGGEGEREGGRERGREGRVVGKRVNKGFREWGL